MALVAIPHQQQSNPHDMGGSHFYFSHKHFSTLLIITFLATHLQAQIEVTVKSLELEDANAAAYYLKKVPASGLRDLLDAEIAFLNEDYILMAGILKRIDETTLSTCDNVRLAMLTALEEHKANNYATAEKIFILADRILAQCKPARLLTAHLDYWKGYSYLEQNQLMLAERSLKNSLTYFSQDSSRFYIKLAHLHFWLGTLKLKQVDFDSALYHLTQSLTIYLNTPLDKTAMVIKIYNNMGATHAQMWNYKEAFTYYQKAIQLNKDKIKDARELTLAYSNLGQFYDTFGNFLESEKCYQQALHWMESDKLDPKNKALILQNFGTALANNYEPTLALSQYMNALEVIRPYNDTYGNVYTRILLNIISTYNNQEMPQAAEKWSIELEQHFARYPNKWIEQETEWKISKALSFTLNKNYSQALTLLNELEDTFKRPYPTQYYVIIDAKAANLKEVGNYRESRAYYFKLIKHYQAIFPDTHPQLIQLYNQLGSTFVMQGNQPDSSNYYLQIARKNNQIGENKDMPQTLYASKIEWLITNYYLLKSQLNAFKSGQITTQQLIQAEGLIFSSLSVVQSKRIELREGTDAINLQRLTHEIFDEAMDFYYTLYKVTNQKEYADKAFFIMEKTKYQTLHHTLKLDRVSAFAQVTQKVLDEERKLSNEITQLEFQYSQEVSKQTEPLPELVNNYVSHWQSASGRFNFLLDSIKNNLPDYYNLKFNRSTTEISQIQSGFLSKATDMAWVSYYVGYTDCFALVITHDDKYFLKLGPSEKITRQLKLFNNYVSHNVSEELQQNSHALYSELFEPIDSCLKIQAKKIKKVVIIPDGSLNYLNFELLGRPSLKTWHYALYDYQFSYGYSTTLLYNEFSDQPKWKTGTLSMIGFAPEFVRNSDRVPDEAIRAGNEKPGYDFFDFSPLEKNQEEVEQVAKILKRKKMNTTLYLGSKADESSFKKANLKTFNIVHLATHGFVSEHQQNLAGIAFAKKENSQDDGILYMDEIFNLKNRANLVCLSACETGSGIMQQGEGLVGLTRAFIYSGAQNLVVSLWKVQDESTATLMTNFYSNLVRNQSVSESLQQAKIAMIKKNPTIHPYYWSAFIHVGLN